MFISFFGIAFTPVVVDNNVRIKPKYPKSSTNIIINSPIVVIRPQVLNRTHQFLPF